MIELIKIGNLFSHPNNPRKEIGDITELTESIKKNGVMQNLTVVKKDDENYMIIIGHRRAAAAKMAGLKALPCAVVEMDEKQQIATMLLENMQRADLSIVEQAEGFQMMLDLGDSISEVSEKTGFSESTVRRRIKLNELDKKELLKAENRGGTLEDYAQLDKLKKEENKNKALKAIGTSNFNWTVRDLIDAENREEGLDRIEEQVKRFATPIKDSSGYKLKKYFNYKDSEVVRPEDVDGELYYIRDNYTIDLYTKKEEQPEDEAKKQAELEREEKRKLNLGALEIISKRAQELREEFAKSVPALFIKNHIADILATWMYIESTDSGYYVDEEDIYELAGMDYDNDDEDAEYEDFYKVASDKPYVMLWRRIWMAMHGREYENKYYDSYYAKHKKNTELDAKYALLCKLGYQMSDEEISLQNGSNENFVKDDE